MAAAVLHTWQILLPIHGNHYVLASKLLHSRLDLTRQMRSTISAAHMLLAVGKFLKTIYDSLHTTTC